MKNFGTLFYASSCVTTHNCLESFSKKSKTDVGMNPCKWKHIKLMDLDYSIETVIYPEFIGRKTENSIFLCESLRIE